ncbi:TonB family protein [Flavobacterium sp. RHBU_24]|uniref:TonB family protein n=1 Tax=Flavobacterium sp. RHBU_24 TaxID=3391185 RepID=UPI0039850B60
MKLFYAAACLFISFCMYCQEYIEFNGEKINAIDADNHPTGIWKIFGTNDNHQIAVVTEFSKGERIADTNYYIDSKLFATCKMDGIIQIIKGTETIEAQFYRDAAGRTSLVDADGNELSSEIMKYFFSNSSIQAVPYGGMQSFYKFIGQNADPKLKGVKGKVVVKFTTSNIGKSQDIEIVSSTNDKLNNEAIRLISIMPRWQPGLQQNGLVRCTYTIPLTFN